MKYENRSKLSIINYDKIAEYINQGLLNKFDIIYTKDTHENIIISENLKPIPIRSKIYRFQSIHECEEELNENIDTYEGQIVSILDDDKYSGYIVNKNNENKFYVTPLNEYSGSIDYDTLGNRPIINLIGELSNPIILDQEDNGIYRVIGNYRISEHLQTVFSSVSSNLFLINHELEITYIKKISAKDITDYVIDNELVSTSTIPTTDWIENQGYITGKYVDDKIAALDFITKKEVEDYVNSIITQSVEGIVKEKIDKKFEETFINTSEKEALEIFTNEFYKK